MSLINGFFTVSSLTVVSRLVGIVREALLSFFLGACPEMDAFLIAFKFPRFFRVCLAESGFQYIFVPYLIDFTSINKKKAASLFSSRALNFLFAMSVVTSIIVYCFVEHFIIVIAPGFAKDPSKLDLAVNFTRIIFPSIIFLALSSVGNAILAAHKRFFPYAFSPILINVVIIFSLIAIPDAISPGYKVSIGVLVASAVQYIFIRCNVISTGIKLRLSCNFKISNKFKQILRKFAPITLTASMAQMNVFIDTFFVSFLPSCSITFVYFADRFIQLPLAIFGISMAAVLLPEISIAIAKKNKEYIDKMNKKLIVYILRLTLPVLVLLVTQAVYLISIVYGHGKFSQNAVEQTAIVLQIYAIGLPAYVMAKIFSAILFAQKNTRTPVIAGIISMCCNAILNFLFIKKFGVRGVALATSISGLVDAYILYKKSGLSLNKTVLLGIAKITTACCAMFIAIHFSYMLFPISTQFFAMAVYSIIGCLVYIFVLILLKDHDVKDVIATIAKTLKICYKKRNL